MKWCRRIEFRRKPAGVNWYFGKPPWGLVQVLFWLCRPAAGICDYYCKGKRKVIFYGLKLGLLEIRVFPAVGGKGTTRK